MMKTGMAVAALALVAACSSSQATAPAHTKPLRVVYDVTGSASTADITYSTPGGGTEQQSKVSVPLTMSASGRRGMLFTGFSPGDFVYISAQNNGESGSVTCRIILDGVTVVENTSRGGYTIATCNGTL